MKANAILLACLLVSPAAAAPPVNDTCAGAIPIPVSPNPALSFPVDATEATPQGADDAGLFPASCNANGTDYTVWYTFTPETSALYTFTTCPGVATGETVDDTVLAIFSSSDGTCGGAMTSLACQDSEPSCRTATIDPSTISALLNAGTTYYVVAGHWLPNDTFGPGHSTYVIQVQRSNGPVNDTCDGAIALPLNTMVKGTTVAAADDYQAPATTACFAGPPGTQNPTTAPGNDVVYTFTAPAAGKYSIRWVTLAPTNDLLNQNVVLYASASCPAGGGTVSCLAGANRELAGGSLTTATGASNNRSEELHCLNLAANQQIYVFFDDATAENNGGTFGIEATPCTDEVEPNDTPATATAYAAALCGSQEGTISVAPAYHCVLGSTPGAACQATGPTAGGPTQPVNCGGAPGLCFPDSVCQDGPNAGTACVPRCVGGSVAGQICTANAQCTGGGACQTNGGCGVCTSGNVGQPCVSSATCGTGGVCATGTCGRDDNEGDVDFWSLGNVAPGSKVYATAALPSANDTDLRLRVTTATDTLGFDDDDGHSMYGSLSPVIAGAENVPGGGTYLRVSKTSSFLAEPYHLYAVVEPPIAQAQSENGDAWDITYGWPGDVLLSDPITNGGYVRGTFTSRSDTDCYRMFAHKGDDIVWFGDSNPDRTTFSPAAGPSIPQLILYDADGAGISNIVFTTNTTIRNNGPVSAPGLTSEAPDVTSFFQHWRATYTGTFELCFYPFAASSAVIPGPFPAPYAGAITLNCGPVPPAGPGTTTTDVAITETGPPGPIPTSGQVAYTITITNTGSDLAQMVKLDDPLPPTLRYLSASVDDGFGGNNTACSVVPDPGSTGELNCTTISLEAGASITYALTVQVADCLGGGIDVTNTVTVSTESTDPDSANDSASVSFTTSENDSCAELACDASGCVVDNCFMAGECNAGQCNASARNCDDNNVCTADSCVPSIGCVNDPGAGQPCDDGNVCTMNFCDPIQGCVFPPVPVGTPCDDLDPNTSNDACNQYGMCVGGNAVCDDGNPCTDDSLEFSQCQHLYSPTGTPCEDNDPCTAGNTCSFGVCGTPLNPPETQDFGVAADKQTFSWSPAVNATSYDLLRGFVSNLPVGPGGDEACFGGLASNSFVDVTFPQPGIAYWYLTRGDHGSCKGTFGKDSGGAERLTTSCP